MCGPLTTYFLPLPDEVQTNTAVFSTLDFHSGYWQLQVVEANHPKNVFCPGPGVGLYQFCHIPFGFSGAPVSFQRLMDSVLHGLPFASTYLHDILVQHQLMSPPFVNSWPCFLL